MMPDRLSEEDRLFLLRVARQAITAAVQVQSLPAVTMQGLSPLLLQNGASFVTLTEGGALRGCIGALEPYQPLVSDVQEHAVAAALEDYRFQRVQSEELPRLHIEISRLTQPQRLDYDGPQDLLRLLRPGIDGLILKDSSRRATFLPQVWESLPEPANFLSHLCQKMGAPADLWRRKPLQALIYQVECFEE